MTRRFALQAPGLLRPSPNGMEASTARWPAIESVLARGRCRRLSAAGMSGTIRWLSGDLLRLDEAWPAAPVSLLGEGVAAPAGWWLRADPVHLLPDADRLRLLPADKTDPEVRVVLAKAFNEHFAAEGYYLVAPHAERWYLRSPRPLRIETHALEEALDQYVYDFMPAGPDAGAVRRLMTEAQMIFHAIAGQHSPRGEPAVNSLWLWGGGELPEERSVPLPPLWSDEPFVRGVWLLTGNDVHALPALVAGCLAQERPDGLALLDSLDSARSAERRNSALETLERDWCAPLLAALRCGELDEVVLLPGGAERFELTRATARRFWRRSRPLASGRL